MTKCIEYKDLLDHPLFAQATASVAQAVPLGIPDDLRISIKAAREMMIVSWLEGANQLEEFGRAKKAARPTVPLEDIQRIAAWILPSLRKHLDFGPECHVCEAISELERYSTATKCEDQS